MSKLKGKFAAIKMKYLIFVFVAALVVSLPTRVYQLLAVVDTTNGFFDGSDITVGVLYGAMTVFSILFLLLSFLSKEVPSPKLPTGKNPVLGIGSLVMVLGLVLDIFNIERKIVPQVDGGFNMEIFSSLLSSNLQQNGGVVLVLKFIFAVFAIFYFLIFAISHLNGKASYKEYKILAIMPVCWAGISLVSRLMTAVSFIRVSDLLFEIFMFVFGMLFLFTFARISSGVFTEDSMWGIYGYGFATALFAGVASIPRLICIVSGAPIVEGYGFDFSHLAFMIFVITYIIASLGVGFKDGIKNIRTISEVELPEEVVLKKGRRITEQVEEDFFAEYDEEDAIESEDVVGVTESVETEESVVEEMPVEPVEIIEDAIEEVFFFPEDDCDYDGDGEDSDDGESEVVEESVEVVAEDEVPVESEESVEMTQITVEETDDISTEIIEETPVEDTPVEEVAFDEAIIEEAPVEDIPVEETFVEGALVEDVSIEETMVEDISAPKKKKKKAVSGIFGLKKAPDQAEVADDLKPISLADMKKKSEEE